MQAGPATNLFKVLDGSIKLAIDLYRSSVNAEENE
jgi:hypothetical protein